MRKGVKLAGLLAVGVAAFVVACSPVCNPVPVADPHGTPEQQWNWWRETYATADYGQADLAGYTSLSEISPSAAWKTVVRLAAMSAYASGVPCPLAIAWASLTCWLTAARCCRGAA